MSKTQLGVEKNNELALLKKKIKKGIPYNNGKISNLLPQQFIIRMKKDLEAMLFKEGVISKH